MNSHLPPRRGFAHRALCLGVLATVLPVAALAQSGDSASSDSWWRPGAGRVAVGLNLGRSHFHLDCAAAFPCDKRDTYWSLYGRHMMDDRWGSQLSLVNMGEADRGGGGTRAYGLDLSLVGKVPLTDSLGAYGKLGAIWGHTRVNAAAASGLPTGTENGLGLSLGAGVSWDFTPKLSAVLEWDRYDFKFAGVGREGVRATSLGLQYRY